MELAMSVSSFPSINQMTWTLISPHIRFPVKIHIHHLLRLSPKSNWIRKYQRIVHVCGDDDSRSNSQGVPLHYDGAQIHHRIDDADTNTANIIATAGYSLRQV